MSNPSRTDRRIDEQQRGFTRREAIQRGLLLIGGLASLNFVTPASAETDPASVKSNPTPVAKAAPVTAETKARPSDLPEITQFLIQESAKFGVNNIGYRVSNAWLGDDGWYYAAWQGAILQTDLRGTTQLWNTLSEMHDREMDPKLDNGAYGVTVPPQENFIDGANGDIDKAFDIRTKHFGVPEAIDVYAREMRESFEIGTPTSGAKIYPDVHTPAYRVVRYQRVAVQEWLTGKNKGLVQRILVGDAAKTAGIVPKEVWLDKPDMGTKSGESPINEFVHRSRLTDTLPLDQGKQLEMRVSTDSSLAFKINQETANQVRDLIKNDATNFNYRNIILMIVGSPDNVPLDWPIKGGYQVNLGYYRGGGAAEFYDIGAFNAAKVDNDLLCLYSPPTNLNAGDPAVLHAINDTIAQKVFNAVVNNGQVTSSLQGHPEYALLAPQDPFQISTYLG